MLPPGAFSRSGALAATSGCSGRHCGAQPSPAGAVVVWLANVRFDRALGILSTTPGNAAVSSAAAPADGRCASSCERRDSFCACIRASVDIIRAAVSRCPSSAGVRLRGAVPAEASAAALRSRSPRLSFRAALAEIAALWRGGCTGRAGDSPPRASARPSSGSPSG